jgi:hypothetical protein
MLRSVLLAAVLAPFSVAALAVELVQPAALGKTFFDATPITTTDARGRSSKLVFTPGGALTLTTSAGRASEGKWRLSEEGFCMQVGEAKRESCYVVLKQNDGRYSAMKRSGQPFVWQK